MKAPRVRWFAIAYGRDGSREVIPANRYLGGTWGWDAKCSCGWESRTGGATRRSVRRDVAEHKFDVHGVTSTDLWR